MGTMLTQIQNVTQVPTPGLYRDIPNETYQAWEACSNSRLSHLLRSPVHCRYAIDHPEPPTPALILGQACDTAILQPELFDDQYIVAGPCEARKKSGDRCTNQGKHQDTIGKWFCGMHGSESKLSQIVLTQDEHIRCINMRAAVFAHPAARVLMAEASEIQLSVVWQDGQMLCKARPDILCESLSTSVDLKTTRDASLVQFEKSIFNFGYHRQGAFYHRGLATMGKTFDHHVILAVESEEPHAVAVYRLKSESLDYGKRQLHPLMDSYEKCTVSGEWPAYPDDVCEIGIPGWAERQIEKAVN